MRKPILSFVVLTATSMWAAQPTRDEVMKMSPSEMVTVLDHGPASWFGWCAIVENAPALMLSDNSVREALLRLLERIAVLREKALADFAAGKPFTHWTGDCRDECGECLARLEQAVADTHGPRALEALVKMGSMRAATFGDAAIPLALARYGSVPHARAEMIHLVGHSTARAIKPASRAAAESAVFEATYHVDPMVRRAAVKNLRLFNRKRALGRLNEIAQADAESFIHKEKKTRIFPIRAEAQREIERLSKSR